MSRLIPATESRLKEYLQDIRKAGNETAKRETFIGLVHSLFPGTEAARGLPQGAEKAVRIQLPDREKLGKIDTYYGNAVIEFERSLKATRKTAEDQLREYCSGVWSDESKPYRPLLAVATDGLTWVTFRPKVNPLAKSKLTPDDIELTPLREFTISDKTILDFYFWLNGVLFRRGQIVPSVEQFQQDFGKDSLAYADALERITHAWDRVGDQREPKVALDNWRKYLTTTYGSLSGTNSNEIEELFFKHTYLAGLARLMVWASLSGGTTDHTYAETVQDVFQGTFFESRQLANIVETDFFQWIRRPQAQHVLEPVWEKIIAQIETYDLSLLKQDILKGVYQELVDPKDRHDLGEYYTPDWLCERIVAELAPNHGFSRVLDPSCGSGSFLRAAIRHFIERNPELSDEELLHSILDNVVGIDVHPLAATIARATYALALGRLLNSAKRPVQIPVFIADSLFLPKEVVQIAIGGVLTFQLTFGNKKVEMPDSLIQSADLFDAAIVACCRIAEQAETSKNTAKSLEAYLLKVIPRLVVNEDREHILAALWKFTEMMAELIREKQNSIWSFILRNSYRPVMMKRSFDLIVGNPPWLSYHYIEDPDYQEEIKSLALNTVRGYGIAAPQKSLLTHMELATVFLAHSMGWFAKEGAKLGFVVPRSVVNGDQHAVIRARRYKWSCRFRLEGYWDFLDVRPIFRVPCVVIFTTCTDDPDTFGSEADPLPTLEWRGKLPRHDLSWVDAAKHLVSEVKEARLIYLGARTAWSTGPGRTRPTHASYYKKHFQQGATVLPRSFYFVCSPDLTSPIERDRLYSIETEPEQAKDSKKPWVGIRLSGQAQGRFLFYTALSRHVVPFALLQLPLSVLPVLSEKGMKPLTSQELRNVGYVEFSEWTKEAERIWKVGRGKKDRESLQDWLDYQGKLTKQVLSNRYLVLYNAPGTNMSSTFFDRRQLDVDVIVEHDLYWTAVKTPQEGHYLTAILNSSVTNEQIKPFQSGGLLGERHIEKKVLDLPIPMFDSGISTHVELAEFGQQAYERAKVLVKSVDYPTDLKAQRALMRTSSADLLEPIDRIVKLLMPLG